jgi:hypothetical protein
VIREPRQSRFFDPRPHRWNGRLGSGNDEWFFFPLRVVILVGLAVVLFKALR